MRPFLRVDMGERWAEAEPPATPWVDVRRYTGRGYQAVRSLRGVMARRMPASSTPYNGTNSSRLTPSFTP